MNLSKPVKHTVPKSLHGKRIDVVLAQLFPDYSRSQLSNWLKQELIRVDDRFLRPKDKVQEGSLIELLINWEQLDNQNAFCLPEQIPLDIIYEDDFILVINKQAGLIVHPGAGNPQHTLVNALLHHASALEHLPRAGIIHRLDKDTTGLLIIAKTMAAHTSLIRQMHDRQIQRQYIALVYGHLIASGEVNTFFGRHPRNRLKMAVCTQGRQAITFYSVKKQYHFATLLDVNLHTGRTHQIRVHMEYINHPVIGDPLYGGKARLPAKTTSEIREAIGSFNRQALHAASLSVIHPEHKKALTFIAPLPHDFQQLLNVLELAHLD